MTTTRTRHRPRCCLAVNALFYQFDSGELSVDSVVQRAVVGVLSSLLVFIPTTVVSLLFRHVRPRSVNCDRRRSAVGMSDTIELKEAASSATASDAGAKGEGDDQPGTHGEQVATSYDDGCSSSEMKWQRTIVLNDFSEHDPSALGSLDASGALQVCRPRLVADPICSQAYVTRCSCDVIVLCPRTRSSSTLSRPTGCTSCKTGPCRGGCRSSCMPRLLPAGRCASTPCCSTAPPSPTCRCVASCRRSIPPRTRPARVVVHCS